MALNGFWDKLKGAISGAVTAIGGAIGGPFGAYVGSIAGEALSSWIDGRKFDTDVFIPGGGLFNFKSGSNPNLLDEFKLQAWHDNIFKPWILSESSKLNSNGIDVSKWAYRSKVNSLLLKLEALRLYYKTEQEVSAKQIAGKGSLIQEVDLDNAKSKSEIIAIYVASIKEAYQKTLKDQNVAYTMRSVDFEAHKASFNFTEPLNWLGTAKTQTELFAISATEPMQFSYNNLVFTKNSGSVQSGGGKVTTQPGTINIQDELSIDNGSAIKEVPEGGTTVQTASAGKWFAAVLIAIGIGSYYNRKKKK